MQTVLMLQMLPATGLGQCCSESSVSCCSDASCKSAASCKSNVSGDGGGEPPVFE